MSRVTTALLCALSVLAMAGGLWIAADWVDTVQADIRATVEADQ